jgi:hypothetical protein
MNTNGRLTASGTIQAPNPYGYTSLPQTQINVLNASWVVTPFPPLISEGQEVEIELTPNNGDARDIVLSILCVDSVTGIPISPQPQLGPQKLGPFDTNQTIYIKVTMPEPGHVGNFTCEWITDGFGSPEDSTTITLHPRTQMLLSGITMNDTDLTLLPRPALLELMYGRIARIVVYPHAMPVEGELTLHVSPPTGTQVDVTEFTWGAGDNSTRVFYFSFTAASSIGAINFTIGGSDAPHFKAPTAVNVLQYSQCSAEPPPCVNSLQCTDVPSTMYPTSYTCVCKFGYSGYDCSIQIHPSTPESITTAVIAPVAPVLNPNCDLVMLDGSSSFGLGVEARSNSSWSWSLAAVNTSSGASFVVSGSLSTVRTSSDVIFNFTMKSTGAVVSIRAFPYADHTGFGVIAFRANQLPPAVYQFALVVNGLYDSSPPTYIVLDTSKLPAPTAGYTPNSDKYLQSPSDWMPSLHMHIPEPVRRTVDNRFDLDLINSACAPIPDVEQARFNYTWKITPVGPIGKNASLAEWKMAQMQLTGARLTTNLKALTVPQPTLISGWMYKLDAQLTITLWSQVAPAKRRLLSVNENSDPTGRGDNSPQCVTLGRGVMRRKKWCWREQKRGVKTILKIRTASTRDHRSQEIGIVHIKMDYIL